MGSIKTVLFCAFACCFIHKVSGQYITVDDTKTAQQLVENVLINSSCANVSNFAVTGDTYTAGRNSYGYFNSGTSGFPFTEGVVLSTGSSRNSEGPFIPGDKGGGDTSWLGDTDLEQALGLSNNYTKNATALEFDFIPLTNFISFNYIFASNEYQNIYPCNFSDGFAFLIKENIPGSSYQNLAVLPGTDIPVSSKNVHPAISPVSNTTLPINGCPAAHENYFQSFNTGASPINYAGQTKIMNAQATVTAGKTYHVKLVIADAENRYFDSAIFLEAGSFTSKIDLGADRLSTTNNPICFGENLTIDTKLPTGLRYTYKWYKDGSPTPIPGETTPSYVVTTAGTYRVEVELGSPSCISSDEIKMDYTPEIVLTNTSLVQCDGDNDGITVFDLTKADAIVKNNNPNISSVEYYGALMDAQGQINPIANPTAYRNTALNQTIFARVINTLGCVNYAEVKLLVSNNSIATQNPVLTCDGDNSQEGLYHFDLNSQVSPQVLSGLPPGLVVEYYLNSADAISQKNPLPNIFNNTIANQQTIYARIVNGPDCYGITPVTLVVNTFDPPNFQDENAFLCDGSHTTLAVNSGFSSYLWNTGAASNTIDVTTPGNYSVRVTDPKGCEKTKNFIVSASGIATITGAPANDFAGNENSVLIQYIGLGNYEFSLDGSYFQDNPQFNGVAPGIYWATAKDKNGCGTSNPFQVYVLDYPRFFTPNGDSYNDVWTIKNLDLFPKATVTIFNRYGKLLKHFYAASPGWNGTFNGANLPATDYWFHLTLDDGRVIKGHFSLKR